MSFRYHRMITLLALAPPLAACSMSGSGPAPGFAAAPLPPAPMTAAPDNGAIFQANYGYSGLHEGLRARRVGDLVTIVLVESIGTSKSAAGQTARNGSASITPPTAGPLNFLNPDALKMAAQGSFKGSGNASQRSTLNGAIAVTIAEVRSNGTASVVGEKEMALSQGDEWVQFAGTLRLADIDSDNRVLSSRIANARIIYSGKGAIQQASRPGWLSRFFTLISPF